MPPPPKKRGVLYVVWGHRKTKDLDTVLKRSMRSIMRHHPDFGIKVHELPEGASLLEKSRMYDWSPFEQTLYLDADTVVLGKLDFAFEQAGHHHLALSICEAPYARRYSGMISGDVIEYNTGVMFFHKRAETERLFREWERIAFSEDSSHTYLDVNGMISRQVCNDQASFAKAAHSLRFNPFVLPCNWNFRSVFVKDFFGPLKVWHDYSDPPQALVKAHDNLTPQSSLCFGRVD